MGTGLKLVWSCWLHFSCDRMQQHFKLLNLDPANLLPAALTGKAWPMTNILHTCVTGFLANRDVCTPAASLADGQNLNLIHSASFKTRILAFSFKASGYDAASSTVQSRRHGCRPGWCTRGYPGRAVRASYSIICPPEFTFDSLYPYLLGLSTPVGNFPIYHFKFCKVTQYTLYWKWRDNNR